MKQFDMYKCTVAEVRLVQCKNLRYKCVTPYSSTNGGDYAHMLELFMVVDFPNGLTYDSKGTSIIIIIFYTVNSELKLMKINE